MSGSEQATVQMGAKRRVIGGTEQGDEGGKAWGDWGTRRALTRGTARVDSWSGREAVTASGSGAASEITQADGGARRAGTGQCTMAVFVTLR